MAHLINSTKQKFGICSIQSGLREVGLYSDNVDGLFGKNAYAGFEKLIGHSVERADSFSAKIIFLNLQRALNAIGKETGGMDGIWGKQSQNAFNEQLENYRRSQNLSPYWFAWSGNKHVTQTSIEKIKQWLKKWDKPEHHVSYLLTCINFETAGTFSPSKENTVSHALGLIQFMPKKLKEWKIDAEDFASLSFDKQLDYVFRFFEEYGYIKKCRYLEDYYLSIFYPAMVGKNPDGIIAKRGNALYSQNQRAFDRERRGFYTAGDVASPIFTRYWLGMDPSNRLKTTQLES